MKLIVGLGNVGKDYSKTRHNAGFMAIDYFANANKWPPFKHASDWRVEVSEHLVQRQKVILAKPQTMMNDSGLAIASLVNFYKAAATDVMVIYDELDLPFGSVRIREGGGTAGHKGVESTTQHIGSGFLRVRIGIANKVSGKREVTDFVLGRFSADEESNLPHIFDYTNHVIHEFINSSSQLVAHTQNCLPSLIEE